MYDEIRESEVADKVLSEQPGSGHIWLHPKIKMADLKPKVHRDSGQLAAYAAAEIFKPKKIYLVGFDFYSSSVDVVNNIYKGTKNYEVTPTGKAIDEVFHSWKTKVLSPLAPVKFVRVGPWSNRYKELKTWMDFIKYKDFKV
jgi:hypothetical protein